MLKLEALSSSKNVTTSLKATCLIVPASFTTTRSAAARVVDVAEVLPSQAVFISVVVAVTPSIIFNSAVVAVTPSMIFNSEVVAVTPSMILSSDAVAVTPSKILISEAVEVNSSEIKLCELKYANTYLTVHKKDWSSSLAKAMDFYIENEQYEMCALIKELTDRL